MVGPRYFIDADVALPRTSAPDDFAAAKEKIREAISHFFDDADITITMTAVPVDSESIMDRVFVIARNKALAVHHVTVHELQGRYAVSLDLELEGHLTLGTAHEMADDLEKAIEAELGPNVEVETHIEPLPAQDASGREALPARIEAVQNALVELAIVGRVVRDIHDVRVRESDDGEIVNFHCHVDPDLSVQAVHESVDAVERALRERFPSIKRVIGHAEPILKE
jgi:divalent metal cation (Fe/Co/Zn/Cd) transporter